MEVIGVIPAAEVAEGLRHFGGARVALPRCLEAVTQLPILDPDRRFEVFETGWRRRCLHCWRSGAGREGSDHEDGEDR